MNFDNYYNIQFRTDIRNFFMTIPDESKYHEDRVNKQILSIQYERLSGGSRMNPKDDRRDHLDFLTSKQDKENFGVALFFTILADEVFYTYYKENYNEFQNLTRYPKFIGNCLSWCHYHLHPQEVFSAMNRNSSNKNLIFYDTFFEAIPIMEREIKDFFCNYMPRINGQEFWDKCVAEFPFKPIERNNEE